MTTKMLINAVASEEFRVATIKDGKLDGFHIDTSTAEQKTGNIYKGAVERIEPRLQACFVDFGADRNGFLSIGDIHPEYYQGEADLAKGHGPPPIDKVLKKGQEVLVEVVKEMPGRKGAQLTTYISLAGRYRVLTPGRTTNGVSRKIENEEERQRLKSIMERMKLPEDIGYIVRTVAEGHNQKELSRDLSRLLRLWKNVKKKVPKAPPRSLIHKEQDLCLRTLRDYYTTDISEILVDDRETYNKVKEYMKIMAPRDHRLVKLYKEKGPIFDHYSIEKQIESIYSNRVPLKSGGSIVIDSTEALISIDVNSGRSKGGTNIETMVYKTNLEAASEIARQLRLRDLGGLIVVDFIDMKDRKHNREVEKVFREELKKDRAKIDTSHISKFGLLEMSRQRLRPSIESKSYQSCAYCQGRGVIMSVEAAAVSYMRRIWLGVSQGDIKEVHGILSMDVVSYLQNRKRKELTQLEDRYGVSVVLLGDHAIPPGDGKLEFIKSGG